MNCEHTETIVLEEPWPTGVAVEVCTVCAASRTHWEQGESNWMPRGFELDVSDDAPEVIDQARAWIENQRIQLERVMGEGYETRTAFYLASKALRELTERLQEDRVESTEMIVIDVVSARSRILAYGRLVEAERAKQQLAKSEPVPERGTSERKAFDDAWSRAARGSQGNPPR